MTAIKRNTPVVCLPRLVYASSILKGVLPVPVLDWASEVLGISDSMNDFKGRQPAGDLSSNATCAQRANVKLTTSRVRREYAGAAASARVCGRQHVTGSGSGVRSKL